MIKLRELFLEIASERDARASAVNQKSRVPDRGRLVAIGATSIIAE